MTANADHALKRALRSPGLQMALIALGMLAVVTLLFVRSMARPLNHDEEQFIAPAVLLLRDGLLPYRDYPFFHTPDLVFVFAGVFWCSSHLLLAARCFSAVSALLLLALAFAVAARAFRHWEERWLIALGFFLLLGLNRGFDFTAGRAWNHDVAVLAAVAAFLAFLHGQKSNRGILCLAVCGFFIGIALGTRLSFAPLLASFALASLSFRFPGAAGSFA